MIPQNHPLDSRKSQSFVVSVGANRSAVRRLVASSMNTISNKLGRVVLPTEPEWRRVMDGEVVPAAPGTRSRPKPALTVVAKPAWNQGAGQSTAAPAPAPASSAPAPAKPASTGPAWLNG